MLSRGHAPDTASEQDDNVKGIHQPTAREEKNRVMGEYRHICCPLIHLCNSDGGKKPGAREGARVLCWWM
jgi:hypothetical protein